MAEIQDDKDMYVWNPPVGEKEGGEEFKEISTNPEDYITSLEFHLRNGQPAEDPDERRINGIVVNWSIRAPAEIGKIEGDRKEVVEYKEGDRIKLWVIRINTQLYGMYYRSNRNPEGSNIGGKWGDMMYQNCGGGILAGFHGTEKGWINKIGLVFYKD